MSTQPTVVYATPGTHGQVIPVQQGMTSTAQVILIPAPSSPFAMNDTQRGCFVSLGTTQVVVGVLCMVFNIGAIVVEAIATMYVAPGIWAGIFVSIHDDAITW